MRDNVVEELRQLEPKDETKQKMLDILRRFHSEEETDDMDMNMEGGILTNSVFFDIVIEEFFGSITCFEASLMFC